MTLGQTKTVIITGAGGFLGKALTAVFVRAGYAVAGIDIDAAALAGFVAVAETEGGQGLALVCDLRDWCQIAAAVDQTIAHFGRIDVVINNATGRTDPTFKALEDCEPEEVDACFNVGPKAALGLMRNALPHLKAVSGCVINIGSGAGLAGMAGLGPYAMSKAALHILTCTAAKEWSTHGVRINSILPVVMTDQIARLMGEDPDLQGRITPPLGRFGDAQTDIGAVALFLASPAASYITGQNIPVDGGHNMR